MNLYLLQFVEESSESEEDFFDSEWKWGFWNRILSM